MANFVYEKSTGTLKGYGQQWSVVSGIRSRFNPIANGIYTAPAGALMAGAPGYGVPVDGKYSQAPFSYTDRLGFSWFFWLGQGGPGIHPDGNVPGTKGCIGITESDTRALFDLLKRVNTAPITVLVK